MARSWGAAVVGGLTVVLAVALGGCGSASEPSPPTGIDELVIPSPTLDPADFTEEVDNPWLPLLPGTEWTYRRTVDDEGGVVVLTVLDQTREIQGVRATGVREVVSDERGRVLDESTAWFAQDGDGNVWSLGEDGVWEAGVDGGQAALAMPARPRLGDGYRTAYRPGVAEDRAQVVGLDGSASVPYGDFTDLLEVETSSPLDPGVVVRQLYARDVGLVRAVPVGGEVAELQLLSFVRS